jgi:hypothetical protein
VGRNLKRGNLKREKKAPPARSAGKETSSKLEALVGSIWSELRKYT